MKTLKSILSIFIILLLWGCAKDNVNTPTSVEIENANLTENQIADHRGPTNVQNADVFTFQPAGDFGGPNNVLTPGDFFPPGNNSFATLKRKSNSLHINIHTTGLPEGAYTVWWLIFNEPTDCNDPNPAGGECAGTPESGDIFLPTAAIVWATGGVVQANGVGNFNAKLKVGEQVSEIFHVGEDLDSPLENPQGAEVHFAIKYHGLASDDPEVFYDQTHTLLGNCDGNGGANSFDLNFLDPPIGPYQCFDPQAVVFVAPE